MWIPEKIQKFWRNRLDLTSRAMQENFNQIPGIILYLWWNHLTDEISSKTESLPITAGISQPECERQISTKKATEKHINTKGMLSAKPRQLQNKQLTHSELLSLQSIHCRGGESAEVKGEPTKGKWLDTWFFLIIVNFLGVTMVLWLCLFFRGSYKNYP